MRQHKITCFITIFVLVAVLILPVNLIAQSKSNTITNKKQSEKESVLKNSSIKNNSILQEQLSKSAEIYKKIPVLKKMLLSAKTALFDEQKARLKSAKNIVMLAANIKSIKSKLVQRDTQLVLLQDKVKGLQALVGKTNTGLIASKDSNKQINEGNQSKKILALEKVLSVTKAAQLSEAAELVKLQDDIKTLEALVSERDTELDTLKDEYKKSTKAKLYNEVSILEDVITCYRKAIISWDNTLHSRVLTEQDRSTISTELRSNISSCPSI
jgi:hypothetical protein